MNGIGGHHRPFRGNKDDWLTPPAVIAALGAFDLDPCGYPGWKTAKKIICPPKDGLAATWSGRVWLNPPYGPQTGEWLARLQKHGNGIALIFARTETSFFRRYAWTATALLFLSGRLFFHHGNGGRAKHNAGGPSVLVAYGDDNANRLLCSGLPGGYAYLPFVLSANKGVEQCERST